MHKKFSVWEEINYSNIPRKKGDLFESGVHKMDASPFTRIRVETIDVCIKLQQKGYPLRVELLPACSSPKNPPAPPKVSVDRKNSP